MAAYGTEILIKLSAKEEQVVLILDQTHINKTFEMLMVSVRFNNRALPLGWVIKETQGPIGFEEQKQLLDRIVEWISERCKIVLMGDRAYGTPGLIQWCQKQLGIIDCV